MATNTTIPPKEEKQPLQQPADLVLPTYAPPAPTAAYGDSDQAAIMQQMIADYVNRTDPQAQAEQDARTQRGRQFWTGANLFANVVANAINAGGTAKGAPSMTWNDNASQKMYDTWRDQDRELKADRKAAQQRLDALRLQDAQFRMAEAQARDKAALDAYNRNYEAGERANQINYGNQVNEYNRRMKEQREDEVYQRNLADQRQNATTAFNRQAWMENKRQRNQQNNAMRRNGFDPDDKRVLVGNGYFKADNQREAESHIWNVFQMVRDAWNADDGTGNPRVSVPGVDNGYMPDTSDINTAYSYVAKYFRNLYQPGSAFKTNYDTYFSEYGANAASHPSGGGQRGGDQNNQGGGFRL